MMKYPRFLFALIVYSCLSASAQNRNLTLKELKDGFKAQYIDKQPTATLDSMDVVYFSAIKPYEVHTNDPRHFICANPALHKAGDIVLPKSKFVILDEDEKETGQTKYSVYWLEPRQELDSKENLKIRNTLRKKYGSLEVNDTTVLIPAKWFSGEIMWIVDPYLYGNQYVSELHGQNIVKEGIYYRDAESLLALAHDWDIPSIDLPHTIYAIEGMQENAKTYLPPRTSEKLRKEKQVRVFQDEVCRYIDRKFLPLDFKSREYTVMLRKDETLKDHLYTLEDDSSLTTQDRLALSIISMAIDRLSIGSFRPLWCERGLYPAIFLKVSLTQRGGCRIKLYEE